jgi:hypothetical protein
LIVGVRNGGRGLGRDAGAALRELEAHERSDGRQERHNGRYER